MEVEEMYLCVIMGHPWMCKGTLTQKRDEHSTRHAVTKSLPKDRAHGGERHEEHIAVNSHISAWWSKKSRTRRGFVFYFLGSDDVRNGHARLRPG